MPSFKLVPAQRPHAVDLQGHLSSPSVEDCLVVNADPDTICVDNLRTSEHVVAAVYASKCIALAGVTMNGQVWLLTRDEMPRIPTTLARATWRYIEQLKARRSYLYCWARTTNTSALHWLGWLGFRGVTSHAGLIGYEWRRS